jgi:hypothetical protein
MYDDTVAARELDTPHELDCVMIDSAEAVELNAPVESDAFVEVAHEKLDVPVEPDAHEEVDASAELDASDFRE